MDECVPSVTVEVKMGSKIAETLEKDLIEPFNPDLVICGVRGLSNIRYAFVGSVSTQLVHNMRCDVLVVHPEAIDGIPYEEYEPYGIEIV
jgi:nucleotide-binding universal stress UspA family protein